MKKHLKKAGITIAIISLCVFSYFLVNRVVQEIILGIVNSTIEFSGAKLMMSAEDLEKNIPGEFQQLPTINGYMLDYEDLELRYIIFTLVTDSRFYNKAVYLSTRNENHEIFGITKYSSDEEKELALKKYGFKYNPRKAAYSRNGINVVITRSYIQIWIDNPDDLMSNW